MWINKAGPEVSTYIECLNEFLEISDSILGNEDMQEGLPPLALVQLKALSEDIEALDKTLKSWNTPDIQALLANPKWHAIQSLAKDLYNTLMEAS